MKQRDYILWAAALKWVMKWWNQLTSWGKPTKWQTSKDYVIILSFFFLCFRFLSLYSWLRQSLFLLMRFKQINPKQFFRTWCWFCVDVRMFSVAVNFVNRSPSSFSLSICIFYSMNNFFFMFFYFLTGTDANGFPLREEFAKSCFETLLQFSFVNGTSEVDQLAEQQGRNCSSFSYLESDKIVKCATSCWGK